MWIEDCADHSKVKEGKQLYTLEFSCGECKLENAAGLVTRMPIIHLLAHNANARSSALRVRRTAMVPTSADVPPVEAMEDVLGLWHDSKHAPPPRVAFYFLGIGEHVRIDHVPIDEIDSYNDDDPVNMLRCAMRGKKKDNHSFQKKKKESLISLKNYIKYMVCSTFSMLARSNLMMVFNGGQKSSIHLARRTIHLQEHDKLQKQFFSTIVANTDVGDCILRPQKKKWSSWNSGCRVTMELS